MRIGTVNIPNNVVLAPMAGVTDKSFRIIAREHGCGLVCTEMISAKALTYKNVRTKALLNIEGEKSPISVQLFGSEPDIMREAALIVENEGADLIDINMGCPVPKIVKNKEGSALLENPELAYEIVKQMVAEVRIPVTVKIRIGWNKENIVAVEFARKMEAAGASAVAVHGRTREQFYAGKADWDVIKQVKESLSIPVIGNGDVWTPQDAANMLDMTGCNGIMLGRGVMGNPWLISQTIAYLEGRTIQQPSLQKKIEGAISHLDMTIEQKGEHIGVREMRKHLAWYLKGYSHTAKLKDKIFHAIKREEIVILLQDYISNQEGNT